MRLAEKDGQKIGFLSKRGNWGENEEKSTRSTEQILYSISPHSRAEEARLPGKQQGSLAKCIRVSKE